MRGAVPTFIVIGAAKAGTTFVASELSRHPAVFVTDPKEPGYFTGRGPFRSLDDYLSLFDAAEGASARGEASTVYTRRQAFPGVPQRIHQLVPDARLVYAIRDPMERLRSHYLMRLRIGTTEGSFEEFVTRNDWYVEISCYAEQLREYLDLFSVEQIHVVRLEDISVEPVAVMRGIATHIGVDPGFFAEDAEFTPVGAAPLGPPRRAVRVPSALRKITRTIPEALRKSIKEKLPRVGVDVVDLQLSADTQARLNRRFSHDQRELVQLLGDAEIRYSDY